jgi:hypothetical protein
VIAIILVKSICSWFELEMRYGDTVGIN